MAWLTGYDGWSFYVHQGVLLGLEGEPVWWAAAWTRRAPSALERRHHDNIVGYDDTYVQNLLKHPMKHGGRSGERGSTRPHRRRDGITGSRPPPTTLKGQLDDAQISDATGLV
ncbi:MAG: hypothetical protein U1E16_04635 [Hyphomicrobiales bacterium]